MHDDTRENTEASGDTDQAVESVSLEEQEQSLEREQAVPQAATAVHGDSENDEESEDEEEGEDASAEQADDDIEGTEDQSAEESEEDSKEDDAEEYDVEDAAQSAADGEDPESSALPQDDKNEESSLYSAYEDVGELIDQRYRWYIINTFAGSEDSAKLNLLDRMKRFSQEECFRKIVIPKVTVERLLKSGERKKIEKTSFPGYMFVQMDLTDAAMAIVVNTPRVMGFLGNHKHPKPMSDRDVLRFLGTPKEDELAHQEEVLQELSFEKDQAIRVIDGPFANFDGIVEEVRADKIKLKVLVSILGRETPVELSYNQVEKVDE